MNNIQLGNKGEKEAVDFLIFSGYKIIAKNWKKGKKEIDIIAKKNNTIAFIEVKTRSTDAFMDPAEAVDSKKQRNIIDAAEKYIIEKNLEEDIRFDIITLVKDSNNTRIEHYEDAFRSEPRFNHEY